MSSPATSEILDVPSPTADVRSNVTQVQPRRVGQPRVVSNAWIIGELVRSVSLDYQQGRADDYHRRRVLDELTEATRIQRRRVYLALDQDGNYDTEYFQALTVLALDPAAYEHFKTLRQKSDLNASDERRAMGNMLANFLSSASVIDAIAARGDFILRDKYFDPNGSMVADFYRGSDRVTAIYAREYINIVCVLADLVSYRVLARGPDESSSVANAVTSLVGLPNE